MNSPLDTIRAIGDKLIRETPFDYRLGIREAVRTLDRMHCLDFGRTFGLDRQATAFAWTQLTLAEDTALTLELEHNDGCRIWLDGELVYDNPGDREIRLQFDERSIVMTHRIDLHLARGTHDLLIKSETRGQEWSVFLQPPATKGAVMEKAPAPPEIGLHTLGWIDDRIAELSNWLVIGPFPNDSSGPERTGLSTTQPPEQEIRLGRMYPGLDGPVTWTIPKVDILGEMVDPLPWGTNYNWNYHNGGVAWAMLELADLSGDRRYADYAAAFCDFHLDGVPFVEHQVRTLHAVDSANHFIIDTPLLDFTLAPSLPFINRLRKEEQFPRRREYAQWVDRMLHYARHEQIRLPGSSIYTRTTPVEYTTWVDDMFMGIPFLVQAALCSRTEAERSAYLDDAARQTLEFNTQVWDEEAQLYMHARYSDSDTKLPHWSRCNGWASWAMSEVLEHLPASHPDRAPILAHFRTHCESLLRCQNPGGLWPNVLDHPESPLEVSGSSIFIMAMARGVRNGWLEEAHFRPAVLRGWDGLVDRVEEDGTVHDICMGTMCTTDLSYYLNRPLCDNDTHGLFGVLFAGIEMERLLQPETGPAGTTSSKSEGKVANPGSAALA